MAPPRAAFQCAESTEGAELKQLLSSPVPACTGMEVQARVGLIWGKSGFHHKVANGAVRIKVM